MGIKSLLESLALQEKQIERPFKKDIPVLNLSAMTAIKLPKAAPNKNIIAPKIYPIYLNITYNMFLTRTLNAKMSKAAFDILL